MDLSELLRHSHGLRVARLADGRHQIAVEPDQGCPGASRSWITSYPPELILEIHAAKRGYVCDEIMREEDPRYVERAIRHEVLGYVDAEEFRGKRILDFGCGSGASTLVMSRLLPPCELVGVDLEERLLNLARLRGATIGEILRVLGARSALLEPQRGDHIDLWYGKLSKRHRWLKKTIWASLKAFKPIAGIHLVPELTLAIRKLG